MDLSTFDAYQTLEFPTKVNLIFSYECVSTLKSIKITFIFLPTNKNENWVMNLQNKHYKIKLSLQFG